MIISSVKPVKPGMLRIRSVDGRCGVFDVRPFINSDAFQPLRAWEEFTKVRSGGYYVEWECGADLSADTIEVKWIEQNGLQGQAEHRAAGAVKRTRRKTVKQVAT